jgi:predicted nucleic acid binding AN1-type Zn finger protein
MASLDKEEKDVASIGQHCSFQTCNRLDFLPVKCDLCLALFCKEHYSVTNHSCPNYDELSQKSSEKGKTLEPIQFHQCKFESCEQKEMVPISCEFCKLNFCLKHRLVVDHNCTARSEPIKPSDSDLAAKNKKAKPEDMKFEVKTNVSEKNSQLAAKLTLMKLRQTAAGPPGLTEQFKYYCFVEYNGEKKPFFFSTKWPVGKCVEFIFEKLKINMAELSKLKLFSSDKQIDSSENVEDLIKKEVFTPGLMLSLKNINS